MHGGAADAAGDEDAYAGFALAADAEWNAELAEAPGTDPDSGDGSAVESVDGGPHWQSSADEGDLGQTIYPHLGFDDDEPAVSSSGAGESGVGEEIDDSAEAAGFHGITGSGAVSEPDGVDPAEDGNTTDYDHLFGATELRSVEDAAIRLDENGHELPKEATGQVAANIPPQPPMPPIAGQRIDGGDGDVAEGDSASSAEESAPAPAWQPPSGLLIDSVPWGNSSTGGPPASPQVTADADTAGDPDHDGHTVMRSALAGEAPVAEPLESRPPTGPMVLARLCPAGHANPPSRSQCSECGAAIDSEPREVGRPRLGRMHISTGDVLDLDHSLVIGRQPSVSRVMGGVMPRLVQVHSASGDISRSHVEVRLDGWDVLLVDLKATNGTVLVREGQAPRRLGQGEQAILLNGDIAELGDGVSLLFEGLL
ncbi:hypothetical protein CVV68_12845 [Arthrobacter livingstonensis]|uniref:FHA domain-containing protein n=1 Tax=Arthrobacter livingstonensis TaxID=670078 RepID=A0A2V5LTZ7_9MICC|nr:hypothetical protein CVV68_12845 [Arthrobacter livingstonensis]